MANVVRVDREDVTEEVPSELRLQSVTHANLGALSKLPSSKSGFQWAYSRGNKLRRVRSIFPNRDDSIVEATLAPIQSSDLV